MWYTPPSISFQTNGQSYTRRESRSSTSNKNFLWIRKSMSPRPFSLGAGTHCLTHHSYDPTATHFLLRLVPSLAPIGTIRAYRPPGTSYYKLSRLVVLKEYRSFRFGRALVLTLHEWVKIDAIQTGISGSVDIICHSQLPVKGFYAK